MNSSLVVKSLGLLFILLAAAMIVPLGVSLHFDDGYTKVFSLTALFIFILGGLLFIRCREAKGPLGKRGAFLLVASSWLTITLLGAIPFYLSGTYLTAVDAWFESASGFTTTGASVLGDIEALPKSILMWRSLSQFLGGMGIIVLSLAILPLLGVGGMELYRAEAPGPTSDKLTARVSHTAQALWVVYVSFIAAQAAILYKLGMTPFDAINHALTTMATGGFSTKNNSIAYFDSPAIDATMSFFMFCAGMSFILHYRFLVRRQMSVFQDRELRFYAFVAFVSTLLLTFFLWGKEYTSFNDALRYATFQITSIISSTGYGTADFSLWGPFAQFLLVSLMVVGGCAGSTAGGIKCVRAMLLIKQGMRELYLMIHPKAVYPLKLGKKPVATHVASAIFGYFFLYIMLLGVTSLLITAVGVDIVTAVSGTISALSNIGPGLGEVGPALNYGGLPDVAKILLSCCMIIGRLEVFTVLVIFTGEFWSS